MPDDIARWQRQRGNLQRMLVALESGATPDKYARITELREQIAAVDEHIADLEKRQKRQIRRRC